MHRHLSLRSSGWKREERSLRPDSFSSVPLRAVLRSHLGDGAGRRKLQALRKAASVQVVTGRRQGGCWVLPRLHAGLWARPRGGPHSRPPFPLHWLLKKKWVKSHWMASLKLQTENLLRAFGGHPITQFVGVNSCPDVCLLRWHIKAVCCFCSFFFFFKAREWKPQIWGQWLPKGRAWNEGVALSHQAGEWAGEGPHWSIKVMVPGSAGGLTDIQYIIKKLLNK